MNVTAIVAAVVSVGSMLSVATGHSALGALFADPNTAAQLTAALGGIAALISAFSAPIHQLVASDAKPKA